MTPKEKAKELVDKFQFETKESEVLNRIIIGDISVRFSMHMAKKSALIAVDEILNDDWYITTLEDLAERRKYWIEVKQEIEQL